MFYWYFRSMFFFYNWALFHFLIKLDWHFFVVLICFCFAFIVNLWFNMMSNFRPCLANICDIKFYILINWMSLNLASTFLHICNSCLMIKFIDILSMFELILQLIDYLCIFLWRFLCIFKVKHFLNLIKKKLYYYFWIGLVQNEFKLSYGGLVKN